MSDFKFNFQLLTEDEDLSTEAKAHVPFEDKCDGDTSNLACEVHQLPPSEIEAKIKGLERTTFSFSRHRLEILSGAAVENNLLKSSKETSLALKNAISQHSDLLPGQYEGGLKLWECSLDLCQYMAECDVQMTGSTVLELGCGGGLPGILAAKAGADTVHFQDFNKDVLEAYTVPNVFLNKVDACQFDFFSGDWASFATLALKRNFRYDIILTSETIYNDTSYPKLYKVFQSALKKTGTILLAAKSVYFGVGGGIDSFIKFVSDRQQFHVETVRHFDTGVFRKILKLRWIQDD